MRGEIGPILRTDFGDAAPLVDTRRAPVQWAVERDEIPYPYKVHDTTLRPQLNITIQKHIANYISRIY